MKITLYMSLTVLIPLCLASSGHTEVSLELYGTMHAMGVIVQLDPTDDPNQDASATLQYRKTDESFRQGFQLTRVADNRFVGSLFRLKPGTTYQVRVSFADPSGDPLNGVVLTSSGQTRSEPVIPTPIHSYCVAPGGSGTVCSEAVPCSLNDGLNQALPGDEVVLRGGTYSLGEITLPHSGTVGAPIMIRSYQGETPVFDGADPATFSWTHIGGGVYRTSVVVGDTHLVRAQGDRLYPYQSFSDLQNLVWGLPGFYADGTTLYVKLAGDADPNLAEMAISRYNYAFYVDKNFIVFEGLTFRNFGQGSWAKAIYLRDASDNLIQNCRFVVNDVGIGIKLQSDRNVIQNNTFNDTVFEWPWDAVKSGSELETGGVVFYDPVEGRGNIIRRNTFHDYFDGFNVCPSSTAGLTNETDVYENLVYRAGDDGMETDGQCSNVRIWDNRFHDVLMGISLAPVYTGPVYVIGNLIYRTGVGNNSYSGSPFKFNSGYSQSGPMYLFHNTCDAVLAGNNGLYIKAPGSWSPIFSRNNVWVGTAYAIENYNALQPVDFDYDNLWRETSGSLVRWDNVNYASLAAFTAAVGHEVHGKSANPGFCDPANGDYALKPDSQLIDAGVVIPGINDTRFSGSYPDMGAYEFGATCPDCSGDEVVLTNTSFPPNKTCECIGSISITIGSGVTVPKDATVIFEAPIITIQPGFHAETGAKVSIRK